MWQLFAEEQVFDGTFRGDSWLVWERISIFDVVGGALFENSMRGVRVDGRSRHLVYQMESEESKTRTV